MDPQDPDRLLASECRRPAVFLLSWLKESEGWKDDLLLQVLQKD
jgi:hypothetical protein